ncbi:MAG: hypothetical protein ACREQE_07380 [Candidatus Binataceae bacterium]
MPSVVLACDAALRAAWRHGGEPEFAGVADIEMRDTAVGADGSIGTVEILPRQHLIGRQALRRTDAVNAGVRVNVPSALIV